MNKENLVKRWRNHLQMTQSEFGRFMGRTTRTVAGWEQQSENKKIPYKWLARVLSVSEERFLEGPESLLAEGSPLRMLRTNTEKNTSLSPRSLLVPEAMLAYYCLSDLRESFDRSKADAFGMPDRPLSEPSEYVLVRIDMETTMPAYGSKVLINKGATPKADDLVLVWDEKRKRADLVNYAKRQHIQLVLGVVF